MTITETVTCRKINLVLRLLPEVTLAVAAIAFFGFDTHQNFTFEALRENRAVLMAWINRNFVMALARFVAVYAAGGGVRSAVGFGNDHGRRLSVRSPSPNNLRGCRRDGRRHLAVSGGKAVARRFPVRTRRSRYSQDGSRVPGERAQLHAGSAFSVPARQPSTRVSRRSVENVCHRHLSRDRFRHSRVSFFGTGSGSFFDSNQEISLKRIVTPEILAGLIGLGLLSLVPVVYKRYEARWI